MCFYVTKQNPNAYVAEKDIVCYKVLDYGGGVYQSIHKCYIYSLNKVNEQAFRIKRLYDRGGDTINIGFHSYSDDDTAYNSYESWCDLTQDRMYKDRWCPAVAICVIPQGTKYFFNEEKHRYISEAIMIKAILKQYKKPEKKIDFTVPTAYNI